MENRNRILYIEDDPGTGRLVQKKLGRLGFCVETAPEGKQGLNRVRANAYDLVLIDFWLPGINGLDLLQQIQLLDTPPPVVILTGAAEAEYAVAALKAGAVDYLFKDIDQEFVVQIQARFQDWIHDHQESAERSDLIRDLKNYAQNVAHDLKNPLASLEALTNLLAGDHLSEGQIARYSHAMVNTVEKMRSIVDELLLLATIRQEEIQFHPVAMKQVVSGALERLSLLVEKKNARIHIPAHFPAAIGYESWVEEIWVNYLSNALKYGGDQPDITIGFDPALGGYIRFWIKDQGPGIPKEKQNRLFHPFQRLDHSHVEGHGLGLSIVSRIIEKLGGEVGLESETGEGTLFYFTLPVAPPHSVISSQIDHFPKAS